MRVAPKIIVFEHPHGQADYFLRFWIESADQAVKDRGRFCAAIQGGEALKEILSKLSGIQDYLFWQNIHLFQIDQSCKATDFSSYQFLKRNLFDYLPASKNNIHSILTNVDHPTHAADQYEEDLTRFFDLSIDQSPKFDCIVLTFADFEYLTSVFDISNTAKPLVEQKDGLIQINPAIVAKANCLIVVGTGIEDSVKGNAIEKWVQNWQESGEVLFLLDSVAANQLSSSYEYLNDQEGVILINPQSKI